MSASTTPMKPRPASTDNFLSEREVVKMLDELNAQRLRAEEESMRLQRQISSLQSRILAEEQPAGESARVRVTIGSDLSESEDDTLDLGRRPREAARADVDGMAPIGGELDNFIRLRSYILYMQEGASLLLWREDGLQLCWFWIDRNCSSLHWEIDEQADEEGGVTCEAGGGSILLADITDIVPLGAGPDQLSDSPTDSSFSVVLGGARLDIVAPTSLDFQVWYFGLAFATRLRLNAMASGVAEGAALSESSTDREESEGESDGGWAGDVRALLRRGAASGGATLDAEESRAVLEGMDAQARALAALQKENARLRDERRSKDEAISRLLADLQEAQGARGDGEEGGARREAKTGSEESDRNWQVREVFRARQRARQLDEIARVKNASLQLLTLLLAEATC